MQEPVPQGTIHLVDKDAPALHKKVSGLLRQDGHPATPQSVNPESPLEEFRDKVGGIARVAGGALEENFGSAGNQTHVVTSEGKLPIWIALKRRLLKKAA